MSQTPQKTKVLRPIDPNVQQNIAATPTQSVWVNASAGSGKTKVLTDRILRLLLPDKNGFNATDPEKILAITFTKAAAAEMVLRLQKILSEWATSESDEKLIKELKKLLGYKPTAEQIKASRQLFAKVIDVPGQLKILTIHSFCQSILGCFPIEAGLLPNFQPLEESEAKTLITKAYNQILETLQEEKGSPLAEALFQLAIHQNEEQFEATLNLLLRERKQLKQILNRHFGIDGLYTAICKELDIQPSLSEEQIIMEACESNAFDKEGLRKCCAAMAEGSQKDQEKAITIQDWLDSDQKKRIENFDLYGQTYFTQKNEILKTLVYKKSIKIFPDAENILRSEANRLFDIQQKILKIKTANNTKALFLLGHEILQNFETIKEQKNALDYDDLILKTLALLQGDSTPLKNLNAAPWIRFKLDQGIDHILVDEAQDTNPEQWEIIKLLCDDFFDHDEKQNRSLFVVGDEKQSIYSFQRAAPEKFEEMRLFFRDKIKKSSHLFEEVDFVTSFRSVPAILEFVDSVFTHPDHKKGMGNNEILHQSFDKRRYQPGKVELWPLFQTQKQEQQNPWENPFAVTEHQSGSTALANHIGGTIQQWLQENRTLYSYDRPVEPQDILILVRTRTAFMDQLVRALKIRNIPVSGVDRMQLNSQLVIQDIKATANFALLPTDDLTLACLLKSPFIGLNEEELFNLCYNRSTFLWESVQEKLEEHTVQWLKNLIEKAGSTSPYAFFSELLYKPCPAHDQNALKAIQERLGSESLDPIEEFLNTALEFEQSKSPNLQLFIEHQRKNTTDIKRELEEANDSVRIMTVHGAKGLQAPIVIMPDTIRHAASVKKEKILWPHITGESVPYFCPRASDMPQQCKILQDKISAYHDEEYRRLFYVATTRAESELYIGGYCGATSKPLPDSWYYYAEYGLKNFENTKTVADTKGQETLCYNVPTTGDPDRAEISIEDKNKTHETPEWLFTLIPEEPYSPRPLTPSRPSGLDKEPSLSPLQKTKIDETRFKRGNIIHKLLQILPETPSDTWKDAIANYLAQDILDLSSNQQEEIKKETLTILQDKIFAPIFGQGSKAEVPISGLLDDETLINGQIDRLLVTEENIYIIDYKTNRPPPKNITDVPALYINQMNAYEKAIALIYPNRTIHKALLWTNEARLMILP
ncbi:MAG: double-strand break repair helicase AddA [Pseudomonadota bacterium]